MTRAAVQVAGWMSRDLVAPGDRTIVHLRSTDDRGAPLATVLHVTLDRASFGAAAHADTSPIWQSTSTAADVTTDASGHADWTVTPRDGGYYRIRIEGHDSAQLTTTADAFFWVSGASDVSTQASLEMISDRRSYAVGDTAHVLLNSGLKDASAYVCVEGTTVHSQQVVQLRGNTATVEIPIRAELVPGFYIHASIVRNGQYVGGSLALAVPDRAHLLNVTVNTDEATHRPGEEAVYTVHISDGAGHPVRTEFAMSVVDEALLALQPDGTPDPRAYFYGRRQNQVVTGYSVPREVTGGAYQNVPGRPRPAQPDSTVRDNFKDTAYWNPVLMTDASGTAVVKVRLPDNLTRWKGTVRAITPHVQVGMASGTLTARKDLMVRLAAPRFLRDGDVLELGAEVQNATDQPQEADVTLTADGVLVSGAASQEVHLGPHASSIVSWHIGATWPADTVNDPHARFVVQARAASALADGEKMEIPIEPWGREQLAAVSSRVLPGHALDDRFTLTAGAHSQLSLRLAPSLAAASLGGIDALATYPYGCTEQTMSSFLPDVVLSTVLSRLELHHDGVQEKLPRLVAAGLARLYSFQHEDGGWGWWTDDVSDVHMTAYVLYGLSIAQHAGYMVSAEALRSGMKWLREQAPSEAAVEVMRQRALVYGTAALARAEKYDAVRTVALDAEAFPVKLSLNNLDNLDAFSQAMLADACLENGRHQDARRIMDSLWRSPHGEGDSISWKSFDGEQWGGNEIETTAAVLSVAARVCPNDPRVGAVVEWLMAHRTGQMWGSTRTTSVVLLALAEVYAATHELRPQYTARVEVNGRMVQTVHSSEWATTDLERVIQIPASALHKGENVVHVEIVGRGVLYVSRLLRTCAPGMPAASSSGITLTRSYQVRNANGEWTDTQVVRAGEEVRVVLTAQTREARAHVMIEDRLPAGFEVSEDSGEMPCDRRDVLDDRVAFFFTNLPAGITTVAWSGHAEASGMVRAMPAHCEMMYQAQVNGQTAGAILEVKP